MTEVCPVICVVFLRQFEVMSVAVFELYFPFPLLEVIVVLSPIQGSKFPVGQHHGGPSLQHRPV